MYTLRVVVVLALYLVGLYACLTGAFLVSQKDTLEVVDYLMLTVACMMFGTLIHKVKETKKDESTPNG